MIRQRPSPGAGRGSWELHESLLLTGGFRCDEARSPPGDGQGVLLSDESKLNIRRAQVSARCRILENGPCRADDSYGKVRKGERSRRIHLSRTPARIGFRSPLSEKLLENHGLRCNPMRPRPRKRSPIGPVEGPAGCRNRSHPRRQPLHPIQNRATHRMEACLNEDAARKDSSH